MKFKTIVYLGLCLVLVITAVFILVPAMKTPRNDRAWKPEYQRLPLATIEGNQVTVENLRNFSFGEHGKVLDARYEERRFDLSKLRRLWYGISHFGDFGLAHTFLSFEFDGGQFVTISIEARQEQGESYGPLKGLLGEYELAFIVGDERDIIGQRLHPRGERVYLYPLSVPPDQIRAFFLVLLDKANELRESPTFYNTITDSCTTSFLKFVERVSTLRRVLDYRILLPGYSDDLAWQLGFIEGEGSLEDLRARARLDPADAAIDDPDFSKKIRGL